MNHKIRKSTEFFIFIGVCIALIYLIYTFSFSQIDLKTPDKSNILSNSQQNIGTPWAQMSDKAKAQYYERILFNILRPYILETTEEIYGAKRQYENKKVLYIKPVGLSHEIKVEISTFMGPHNPPYGKDTITFLLEGSNIRVEEFIHKDIKVETR